MVGGMDNIDNTHFINFKSIICLSNFIEKNHCNTNFICLSLGGGLVFEFKVFLGQLLVFMGQLLHAVLHVIAAILILFNKLIQCLLHIILFHVI